MFCEKIASSPFPMNLARVLQVTSTHRDDLVCPVLHGVGLIEWTELDT